MKRIVLYEDAFGVGAAGAPSLRLLQGWVLRSSERSS
jgi:hypothetical protein